MVAHSGAEFPRSGGVGVDIFFVLSGYLITTILSSEAESLGRIHFAYFYMRRFLRLAPALILTVVFFTLETHHFYGRIPLKIDLIAMTYAAPIGLKHSSRPIYRRWITFGLWRLRSSTI